MSKASVDRIAYKVDESLNKSFGQSETFIVELGTPSPTGVNFNYLRALTDITGLVLTDLRLMVGSADYPTDCVAGTEFPSEYTGISITSGSLLCKRF